MLSDWVGPFRVGLISLALMVMGTLIFAFSGTLIYAGLGRVIAGVGAATISIVAVQILALWYRGGTAGTAVGIINTAMPAGTIICFTTFGGLGEMLGWRTPILIPALMGAIVLAAFLLLYKPALNPQERLTLTKERVFSSLLKVEVSAWLVALCWMWFNAAVISFSTFAPDFFISKGHSASFAGFLTSLLMWGSLLLSPMIGRLVDKIGNHDLFIAAGGIILATAISLVAKSTDFLFSMVVMAAAVALIPAPVFSFQSKTMNVENLGLGFGILSTVGSAGTFYGPYLTGLVRDSTGSYEMSFIFLSFLAILVTVTAITLRVKVKRHLKRSHETFGRRSLT